MILQGTKLIVTGSGVFNGCGDGNWNEWEPMRETITEVVLDEQITEVGSSVFESSSLISAYMPGVIVLNESAFCDAHELKNVYMPNVKKIGHQAFEYAYSLTSVDMPNVEEIEYSAFEDASRLDYIGMPDNAIVGDNAFSGFDANGEYSLIPTDCSVINSYRYCGSCGNRYAKNGLGCISDCGTGFLGKGGKCIASSLGCGENYKDMGGFCNRIRYTPAEAAKVLNNDDNEITITFKK